MNKHITVEYWIECSKCLMEEAVTEYTPETSRMPVTKREAWSAAQASGWGGSYSKPLCELCKDNADARQKETNGE